METFRLVAGTFAALAVAALLSLLVDGQPPDGFGSAVTGCCLLSLIWVSAFAFGPVPRGRAAEAILLSPALVAIAAAVMKSAAMFWAVAFLLVVGIATMTAAAIRASTNVASTIGLDVGDHTWARSARRHPSGLPTRHVLEQGRCSVRLESSRTVSLASSRNSGRHAQPARLRIPTPQRPHAEPTEEAVHGLWQNVLRVTGRWSELMTFAAAAPVSVGAALQAYEKQSHASSERYPFAEYLLTQRERLPLQLGSFVPPPQQAADEWRETNWGSTGEAVFERYGVSGAAVFQREDNLRIEYTFGTNGGVPEEAVRRMSELYPGLMFEIEWQDPVLGYFGIAGYKDGALAAEATPSDDQLP